MLTINLKVGTYVEIKKFEYVCYESGKMLNKADFDKFTLQPNLTYNFQGENYVSILGSEIMFLELNN
ncbi:MULTISPECIES: hypothetical protein [Enterococcus]|uniref:Uncharacterized protein n=1 Tax=Enterococcus alishanensis TaxID=1303817 RepID=A0ABS6TGJ7_9ENTE|nr:hypothetical protein [Enterococcus alishanensis]MBV7392058.1 hypothetical protein [Enterococcus alishanensis]